VFFSIERVYVKIWSYLIEPIEKDNQMPSITDFMKFDLRVAQIKEAKEHPDADRLYVLKIDLGDGDRQLVAGIRQSYTTEELIGKKIIVISNLDPATIRGERSEGMLLAASTEDGAVLLAPEKDAPIGSQVK
jgi:methionine--tRNA ligase beta chain